MKIETLNEMRSLIGIYPISKTIPIKELKKMRDMIDEQIELRELVTEE